MATKITTSTNIVKRPDGTMWIDVGQFDNPTDTQKKEDNFVTAAAQGYRETRDVNPITPVKNLSDNVGNWFSSIGNKIRDAGIRWLSPVWAFATDFLWGVASGIINTPNTIFQAWAGLAQAVQNVWEWDIWEAAGNLWGMAMSIFDIYANLTVWGWLLKATKQWVTGLIKTIAKNEVDDVAEVAARSLASRLKISPSGLGDLKDGALQVSSSVGKALQIGDPVAALWGNLIRAIPTTSKIATGFKNVIGDIILPAALIWLRRPLAESYANAWAQNADTLSNETDAFNKQFNTKIKDEEFAWVKTTVQWLYNGYDNAKDFNEKGQLFQYARDYLKNTGVDINTIQDFEKYRWVLAPKGPEIYSRFLENVYKLDQEYVDKNPVIWAITRQLFQNQDTAAPSTKTKVDLDPFQDIYKWAKQQYNWDAVQQKVGWDGIVANAIQEFSTEIKDIDQRYADLKKIDPSNSWLNDYSKVRQWLVNEGIQTVGKLISSWFDVSGFNKDKWEAGVINGVTYSNELERQLGAKKNIPVLGDLSAGVDRGIDKFINAVTDWDRNINLEWYRQNIFRNFLSSATKQIDTLGTTIITSIAARGIWSRLGKVASLAGNPKYGIAGSALFAEIWEELWFDFGQSVSQGEKYDQGTVTATLAGLVGASSAYINTKHYSDSNVFVIDDMWIDKTVQAFMPNRSIDPKIARELIRETIPVLQDIANNNPETASQLIAATGINSVATQLWDATVGKLLRDSITSVQSDTYDANTSVVKEEFWTKAKELLASGQQIPRPNINDFTSNYINNDLAWFLQNASSQLSTYTKQFNGYVQAGMSPDNIVNQISDDLNGKVESNGVVVRKSITGKEIPVTTVRDVLPKTIKIKDTDITPTYTTEKEVIEGIEQSEKLSGTAKKMYKSLIKKNDKFFGVIWWKQQLTVPELLAKPALFNTSDYVTEFADVLSEDASSFIKDFEVANRSKKSVDNIQWKINLGESLERWVNEAWVTSIFSESDIPEKYQWNDIVSKQNVVDWMNNMAMQWNLSVWYAMWEKWKRQPGALEDPTIYEEAFKRTGINMGDYRFEYYKEWNNYKWNDVVIDDDKRKFPFYKITGDEKADKLLTKLMQKNRFLSLGWASLEKLQWELAKLIAPTKEDWTKWEDGLIDKYIKELNSQEWPTQNLAMQIGKFVSQIQKVNNLSWVNPSALVLNDKIEEMLTNVWDVEWALAVKNYLPALSLTDAEWFRISYSEKREDPRASKFLPEKRNSMTRTIVDMVWKKWGNTMKVLSWIDVGSPDAATISEAYSKFPMFYKQDGTANEYDKTLAPDTFQSLTNISIPKEISNRVFEVGDKRVEYLKKQDKINGIEEIESSWEDIQSTRELIKWLSGKDKYDALVEMYSKPDASKYDRWTIRAHLVSLDLPQVYTSVLEMWGINEAQAANIFWMTLLSKDNLDILKNKKSILEKVTNIVDRFLWAWVYKNSQNFQISMTDIAMLNGITLKEYQSLKPSKRIEMLKNATHRLRNRWDARRMQWVDTYINELTPSQKNNIVASYANGTFSHVWEVVSDIIKHKKYKASEIIPELDWLKSGDNNISDNAVLYTAWKSSIVSTLSQQDIESNADYIDYIPTGVKSVIKWAKLESNAPIYEDSVWVRYAGKKQDYYILYTSKDNIDYSEPLLVANLQRSVKKSLKEDWKILEQVRASVLQKRARALKVSQQDKNILAAMPEIAQENPDAAFVLSIEWTKQELANRERLVDWETSVIPYVNESLLTVEASDDPSQYIKWYNPEKRLILWTYISDQLSSSPNQTLDEVDASLIRAIKAYNTSTGEDLELVRWMFYNNLSTIVTVTSGWNDYMTSFLKDTISQAQWADIKKFQEYIEKEIPEIKDDMFPKPADIAEIVDAKDNEDYIKYFEKEQAMYTEPNTGPNVTFLNQLWQYLDANLPLNYAMKIFDVLRTNVVASISDSGTRFSNRSGSNFYTNINSELEKINKRVTEANQQKYMDKFWPALTEYFTDKQALLNRPLKTQEALDAIVIGDIIARISTLWLDAGENMTSEFVDILSSIPKNILRDWFSVNQVWGLIWTIGKPSTFLKTIWILDPSWYKSLVSNFDTVFENEGWNKLNEKEKAFIFKQIWYEEMDLDYNGFLQSTKKHAISLAKMIYGKGAIWPALMFVSFVLSPYLGLTAAVYWTLPMVVEYISKKRLSFSGWPTIDEKELDKILVKMWYTDDVIILNIQKRWTAPIWLLWNKLSWGIPQLAQELLFEKRMIKKSLNEYMVNNGYYNKADILSNSNDINELAVARSWVDSIYKRVYNWNYLDSKLNAIHANTIWNYINLLGNRSVGFLQNSVNNLSGWLFARKIVDGYARWYDMDVVRRWVFQNIETLKAWTVLSKSILWGYRYASLIEDEDENVDAGTLFRIFAAASNIWQSIDSSPVTRAIKSFTTIALGLDEDKARQLKELGIKSGQYAVLEWLDQLVSAVKRRFFFPDTAINAALSNNDTDMMEEVLGKIFWRGDVISGFISGNISSQLDRFIPRTKQDWLTNILGVQLNELKEQQIDAIGIKKLVWALFSPETFGRYFFERIPYLWEVYKNYSIEDGKIKQTSGFPSADLTKSAIDDISDMPEYKAMKDTGELPVDMTDDDYQYLVQKLTQFSYSKTPFNEKFERIGSNVDKSRFVNENLKDALGAEWYNEFISNLKNIEKWSDFKTNVQRILYDIKAKKETDVPWSAITAMGMIAYVMKDGIAKNLGFYGQSDEKFYTNPKLVNIANRMVGDALGDYLHVADRGAFADVGMKYISGKLIKQDKKYNDLFENKTSDKWWIKDTYVKNPEMASVVEWDIIGSLAVEAGDQWWVFYNNALANLGNIKAYDPDVFDFKDNKAEAERFAALRNTFTAEMVISMNEKMKSTAYNEMEQLAIITPIIANNFWALNKVIEDKSLSEEKINYIKDMILGRWGDLKWVDGWIQELDTLYNKYKDIKSGKSNFDSTIFPRSTYFGGNHSKTKNIHAALKDVKLEFEKVVLPKIKDLQVTWKIHEPKLTDWFTRRELDYFKSAARYFGNEPANITEGVSRGKLPAMKNWKVARASYRKIGARGPVRSPFNTKTGNAG